MLRTYKIEEVGDYGVIYLLTSPSGKYYVGQSWHVKRRWLGYRNTNIKKKKLYALDNALLKYGQENFTYEIIDLCSTQGEMDSKEIFYIDLYNSKQNGYNIRDGGSHGKHSQESINKIKKSLSTESNKTKMSKLHSGGNNPNHGIKHTNESKHKMKLARIKNSNLRRNKYLYILENDKKEKFIVKNLNNFCKSIGIKSSYMRHILYGNMKSYKGWTIKRDLLSEENKNISIDNHLFPN